MAFSGLKLYKGNRCHFQSKVGDEHSYAKLAEHFGRAHRQARMQARFRIDAQPDLDRVHARAQRQAQHALLRAQVQGFATHDHTQHLGISRQEAARFIDAYFARYEGVRRFLDETTERARVDGFAQTVLEVVLRHAPDFDAAAMQMRPSSKGNYLAITCTLNATSQAQLDALYRELSSHPMVKVVL